MNPAPADKCRILQRRTSVGVRNSIDCDALDTAIAPGVLFPTPGGLTFDETTDLVRKITSKGRIAGISLFEIRPELDVNDLTASTGAQLIINFFGILAHTGQIGR